MTSPLVTHLQAGRRVLAVYATMTEALAALDRLATELGPAVARVSRGNGRELVATTNGGRVWFASTRSAGLRARGLSLDAVHLDQREHAGSIDLASIVPAILASGGDVGSLLGTPA